jgi:N utilization substance protein B
MTDTSPTIIINEAVELAKCFAEKDAYKFVNGILDEALKKYGKNVPEQEDISH